MIVTVTVQNNLGSALIEHASVFSCPSKCIVLH